MSSYELEHLSDDDLMSGLSRLVREDCQRAAELLAHLAEVDRRQLYLGHAAPSLFAYCVDVLHLSEGAAYKRIYAARAARRFPVIFGMVAAGELHLSAVALLAGHLSDDNHLELLIAARHKKKREVEELLAVRFPKPDVAASLRRLPARALLAPPPAQQGSTAAAASGERAGAIAAAPSQLVPTGSDGKSPPVPSAPSPTRSAAVEPLAAERFKLTLTISGRAREQLRAAQELLAHAQPGCDLAQVIELAVAELVERLAQRRFARKRGTRAPAPGRPSAAGEVAGDHPRAGEQSPGIVERDPQQDIAPPEHRSATIPTEPPDAAHERSRYIPAPIRRAVAERDEYQCTFAEPGGRRCSSRYRLEYHHLDAFARGGAHSADNLTLRCAGHNVYQARLDFGAGKVGRRAGPSEHAT